MHREPTGFVDSAGNVIHTGDNIVDENGHEVTVFKLGKKYRVAVIEHDVLHGISASLGLFIIGGVTIRTITE